GIAKAGDGKTRRWCSDDRAGKLLPIAEVVVLRDHEALGFTPGMNTITQCGLVGRCRRSYGGIDHGWLAVVEDCTAAEYAVTIWTARSRRERDWLVFPVNHVRACGVAPIDVLPPAGLAVC